MGYSEPPAGKGAAIGLIVAGVLCCNPLTLVLGIVSLVMAESNPKASKTCSLIGWILFGIGLVASVIYFIFSFALAASTPTTY
ncbi:hypothetical protein [Nocardiopsis composta]|uniref:Uncharacterized protein n=1 Tax=Nocardiopsis composta TaxID=157465 RepID=A0A7W8VHE9_9ACTN|nr:hypothetical protein [Nocardiopsis composta]MBB5436105.1 hypothetical protein [Nocardiopsis composta]